MSLAQHLHGMISKLKLKLKLIWKSEEKLRLDEVQRRGSEAVHLYWVI